MADEQVSYEVWFGGDDKRYRQAATEEDARVIADEFTAEGQPNVEIRKVTTTTEPVEYDDLALPKAKG